MALAGQQQLRGSENIRTVGHISPAFAVDVLRFQIGCGKPDFFARAGFYHREVVRHEIAVLEQKLERACAAITNFACIIGEDPILLADLRHGADWYDFDHLQGSAPKVFTRWLGDRLVEMGMWP